VDENTSARAALTLAQAGYKVRALKGGWTEWITTGGTVKKGFAP
jgi:rhodanese-related sulfurtransferase